MKSLLVYPEFPPTYWSYSYSLKFVGKKCALPPLSIITVAAMLPSHWRPHVVDLNIERLSDRQLRNADVVMLTGMHVQRKSLHEVLARCRLIGVLGRVPRTKSADQIQAELDAIHATDFRGSVFFVDDNFIGNKKAVRTILPVIRDWQERHGWPFEFYTEASLNLAEDSALMQ